MAAKSYSPKELIVIAGLMGVGLGALIALERLSAHLGITRFTTFSSALAVFLVVVSVTQWRKLHPPNRPGLVLMTCGLSVLATCSVINEFVTQFFTPGRVYLVAAMAPSIAYEFFRYVRSKSRHPDDETL